MTRILPSLLLLTLYSVLFLPAHVGAQALREDFVSFTLENDLWYFPRPSDRFYTNGFRYERIGPRYKNGHYLINKLLIKGKEDSAIEGQPLKKIQYGAFFGQNMYTPVTVDSTGLQPGDRPYAGWLYWGAKAITTSPQQHYRITAEISLGLIGPYSLAAETQTFVHKLTDSAIPQGWSHQIDSDLGLNYMFRYEKLLMDLKTNGNHRPRVEIIWFPEANAGTVFNTIAMGALLRTGFMDNYFAGYNFGSNIVQKIRTAKDFKAEESTKGLSDEAIDAEVSNIRKANRRYNQLFLFVRPQVRYVLYNAMLQGGLLNRASEYTIPARDITRIFFQAEYGIVLTIRSLTVMYSQSVRTREFDFGSSHHNWGTVNVIFNY